MSLSPGGNGQKHLQTGGEGVETYRKAAKQNVAAAQYNLGWMYANGKGVEKDEKEGIKWFRKAAEQGDEDAKAALKELSP